MTEMKNKLNKMLYIFAFILVFSVSGCQNREVDENMNTISYEPLSIQEANSVSPNSYDLQMAIEKGLADKEIYDGDYLEVQAAYMSLLNYYLCENAGLNDYQNDLDTSDFKFPAGEQDVYMKAGSFGRSNIYIRNNIYIERLSSDDLLLLMSNMKNGEVAVNDDLIQMVAGTMQEVISVKYDDTDTKFDAVYNIGAFQMDTAPNDALVIAVSYEPEYDEDGNIVNRDTEEEKLNFMASFKEKIETEMSEKLGFTVCVFY